MQPKTNQPTTLVTTQNTYPGKGLGIAGFVLSLTPTFCGVGLVLCIIAYRQSRRAGFKNKLAQAGIVTGAILTSMFAVFISIMIFFGVSLDNQCKDLGLGSHEVNGATITCKSTGASYDSTTSSGSSYAN